MSINNFIDILLSVLSYLTYQIQFSQSKYYVWNFPKVTTKPSAKPFSWHENKFYLRKSKSSFSYQWLCTWFGNLEMFYFFHFGWLLVGRWMCCNFPLLFLNDCHASLSHLPAITKAVPYHAVHLELIETISRFFIGFYKLLQFAATVVGSFMLPGFQIFIDCLVLPFNTTFSSSQSASFLSPKNMSHSLIRVKKSYQHIAGRYRKLLHAFKH